MVHEVAEYLSVMIREARAHEERRRALDALEASQLELRELARSLETTLERERTRIARELHDELGQALTALRLEVAWLDRSVGDRSHKWERHVGALLGLIDSTTSTVQRITADLRPPILDDLGLRAAIEWECRQFQKRTGLQCELRLPSSDPSATPDQVTAVFRVLQEALTNVTRHAEARHVEISLAFENGELELVVADDGRGISREQLHDPRSLGLVGIRERARALGGSVEIVRGANRGTRLSLRIPCTITTSAFEAS